MRYVACFVLFISMAGICEAQTRSFDLGVSYVWADLQGSNGFEDDTELSFESGNGFGLTANIFFSDRGSLELAASVIEPEATLTFAAPAPDQFVLGDLQMIPITGIVQYHFNPEGRFDFYIGAGVAYVLFDELNDGDDLDDLEIETIDFEDDYGFAANAGMSFDLTRQFALVLDAKYIGVKSETRARFAGDPEPSGAVELEVNPLLVSAGFSFQF